MSSRRCVVRKTYHDLAGSGTYSTVTPVCELLASGMAKGASPLRGGTTVPGVSTSDNVIIGLFFIMLAKPRARTVEGGNSPYCLISNDVSAPFVDGDGYNARKSGQRYEK